MCSLQKTTHLKSAKKSALRMILLLLIEKFGATHTECTSSAKTRSLILGTLQKTSQSTLWNPIQEMNYLNLSSTSKTLSDGMSLKRTSMGHSESSTHLLLLWFTIYTGRDILINSKDSCITISLQVSGMREATRLLDFRIPLQTTSWHTLTS